MDKEKNNEEYIKIKDEKWVKSHSFYPFIHFQIKYKKYQKINEKEKEVKTKIRDLYSSSYIDKSIYKYYGELLNNKYNNYIKEQDFDEVSIAYRNCKNDKCNIHYANEVFEFIANSESAYIFVGDFSDFFDGLDHKYLKEQIRKINLGQPLSDGEYAVYKNITRFSYINARDIEKFKDVPFKDMCELNKYFDTKEFKDFKKIYLKTNEKGYGVPQGASISSIYANVYMIEFDKILKDYVNKNKGIYRRYSDDIIIVIPMSKDSTKYCEVREFVFKTKDKIPNLNLNKDKTSEYFYSNGKIIDLNGKEKSINYLGFSYDGEYVRIREKSLFKYYCRAYKKTKRIKTFQNKKSFNAGKKALYRSYTHLGSQPNIYKKYGNFLTYAYKAEKIFNESKVLKNTIRNQIKRHWTKINNRLKK